MWEISIDIINDDGFFNEFDNDDKSWEKRALNFKVENYFAIKIKLCKLKNLYIFNIN